MRPKAEYCKALNTKRYRRGFCAGEDCDKCTINIQEKMGTKTNRWGATRTIIYLDKDEALTYTEIRAKFKCGASKASTAKTKGYISMVKGWEP